jgi:hypothetical protein
MNVGVHKIVMARALCCHAPAGASPNRLIGTSDASLTTPQWGPRQLPNSHTSHAFVCGLKGADMTIDEAGQSPVERDSPSVKLEFVKDNFLYTLDQVKFIDQKEIIY